MKCEKCGKSIIKTVHNKKYCNDCGKSMSWYKPENRTKYRDIVAEHKYYEKHKDKVKLRSMTRHLRTKYGITPEDVTAMKSSQDNKCKICGDDLSTVKSCIDHQHTTGKIRGILCHRCNVGLGYFKDSTDRLLSAITYLEETK